MSIPALQYHTSPSPVPHRIAYWEWGDVHNARTLICVHGLTRNGRDFDSLAQALAGDYRILCPDMPGRGMSDALADAALYTNTVYLSDLLALMDSANVAQADWVGTSMGGILGMMLAATLPQRMGRMVLNDVGAFIPAAGLKRIGDYMGRTEFPSRQAAEEALRSNYASFGFTEEAQWRHLFAHSLRALPGGKAALAYDPALAAPFADPDKIQDVDLWELWNRTACPTLIMRGEQSDILSHETALAMTASRTHVELAEIANTGHAPALMREEEIVIVRNFLLNGQG
ncbi:MAG: alpha/beta hydrolase [Alphaproteobacteria bacterium]|nr:alpha/beta hydrolase [Alphaproteobacteria bacterium]